MNQESFDPYRKWLGIPPRDQPPNHYRLLGIEVFESDPDVISNAADGRMGQIRTFQTGRHSQLSQQLLNEVAGARVCLLNEAKKAVYDETLRQQLGVQDTPPVVIVQSPSPPPAKTRLASRPSGILEAVLSGTGSAQRDRQRLQILGVSIAAAVVVIGLAVMLLLSGGGPDVDISPNTQVAVQDGPVEDDTVKDDTVEGHTATETEDSSPLDQDPPEDEESMDGPGSKRTMDVADVVGMEEGMAGDTEAGSSNPPLSEKQMTGEPDPDSPNPEPVTPPDTPPSTTPDTPPSTTPDTPPVTPPKTTSDTPPAKPDPRGLGNLMKPPSRSVPAESDQEDARRKIREIFEDDFDSSDTPAAKLALAAKLRQQGLDAGDDPVARFVFLKMSADLAATAANAPEAFKSIDAIKEHYDANALEMKADVLTGVVKVIRGETGVYLAHAAGLLAEEAVDQDDYKMASRLFNLGKTAARKADHKIIADELTARTREVGRTVRAYAPVEKALAVLADDPLDAEANSQVGRWRCFEKNDWTGGLTYLAKGEDTTLAELAQRDLATLGNLIDPDQQQQLGDGWWDLSAGARGPTKAAYMCRAAHWYQKALTGVSGLGNVAIAKRLETIARDKNVIKSPAWGAVEEGNVALATHGTTVEGVKRDPHRLLDGNATTDRGTQGKCPCQWVITFAKPYRLKEIRLRLWDAESRYYRYGILTSSDGKEFVTLADRSQGNWTSWQQFRFPSRLVKSVKIIGLYGSDRKDFVVGEFEAYCVPPKTPPGTTSP